MLKQANIATAVLLQSRPVERKLMICPFNDAYKRYWGDYLGYIPLVTGGHLKTSFLNSYAEVKRIKYCYRYMIIVIRKHTRQAPKHFDDRVGLAVS